MIEASIKNYKQTSPKVSMIVRIVNNFNCQICLLKKNLIVRAEECDHIDSRKIGGKDQWENYTALCKPCNLEKAYRVLPKEIRSDLLNGAEAVMPFVYEMVEVYTHRKASQGAFGIPSDVLVQGSISLPESLWSWLRDCHYQERHPLQADTVRHYLRMALDDVTRVDQKSQTRDAERCVQRVVYLPREMWGRIDALCSKEAPQRSLVARQLFERYRSLVVPT